MSEALKAAEIASTFTKNAKEKTQAEDKARKSDKGAECLRAKNIPSMN